MSLNKAKLKRLLSTVGNTLTLLAIGFVFLKLFEYSNDIEYSYFTLSTFFVLVLGILGYLLGNFILSLAWKRIISGMGVDIGIVDSVRIYGVSQIAKYLPGNIANFASRQLIGLQRGISGKVLIKSTFWELSLLVSSGAVFSVFLLSTIFDYVGFVSTLSIFLLVCITLFIVINKLFAWDYSVSFLSYVGFLLISGAIFSFLTYNIAPDLFGLPEKWLVFSTAFIIAWLVGLVTPGAPAGMGIREVVLIAILGSLIQEDKLLVAVLLSRIVTVLGDLAFFILAWICNRTYSKHEQTEV